MKCLKLGIHSDRKQKLEFLMNIENESIVFSVFEKDSLVVCVPVKNKEDLIGIFEAWGEETDI